MQVIFWGLALLLCIGSTQALPGGEQSRGSSSPPRAYRPHRHHSLPSLNHPENQDLYQKNLRELVDEHGRILDQYANPRTLDYPTASARMSDVITMITKCRESGTCNSRENSRPSSPQRRGSPPSSPHSRRNHMPAHRGGYYGPSK
jgi:hypothetical protein